MADIRAASDGGIHLVLDATEARVLRGLAAEMRALLSGDPSAADPVLERLFPATYQDPQQEAAFRDIVGDELTLHKLRALDAVSTKLDDDGSDVVLASEDVDVWLACITDLRLAIGIRLDVDEDRMASTVDPSDADAHAWAVLHWLGWLQESFLETQGAL